MMTAMDSIDDDTFRGLYARRIARIHQGQTKARDDLDVLVKDYRAMVEQDGEDNALRDLLLILLPGRSHQDVAHLAAAAIRRLAAGQAPGPTGAFTS